MAAAIAAVAAVPHSTELFVETGCDESLATRGDVISVVVCVFVSGAKTDCSQSTALDCVGVARGVEVVIGVGLACAVGMRVPKTWTITF